jgi:hypothetical protein
VISLLVLLQAWLILNYLVFNVEGHLAAKGSFWDKIIMHHIMFCNKNIDNLNCLILVKTALIA